MLIGIECIIIFLVLTILCWIFAGYAYYVNAQLPADNPKKRNFSPEAVHLTLITWPFIIFFGLVIYSILAIALFFIFIVKALLYLLFLLMFTFALVFIRKTFFLVWLEKTARIVGGKLLRANSMILELFNTIWINLPRPA
jgi:hypothetical protein